MPPLRFGYARFASCSGCQLALLNSEDALPQLARRLEPVFFGLINSATDPGGALDLVLVEGSISRPEDLTELLALRRRARVLVAVGACALTGGINALGRTDRFTLCRKVYGEGAEARPTFPPQPLERFVPVDLGLPGCPPETAELVALFGALERGGLPLLPDYPVCMECRQRENLCLLIERRQPCLGPITLAGCEARCPSFGVICEGCRGLVPEANRAEAFRLLLDAGLGEREIRSRMGRFIGEGA